MSRRGKQEQQEKYGGRGRGGASRGRGRAIRSDRNRTPRASIDPFSGPPVIANRAPSTLPKESISVLWFRNDLRVRDNAALSLSATASAMLPIYVFDTRKFGLRNASPWGFQRNGPFRTVFMIESVKELQNTLRVSMSDILVRQGNPVEEILKTVSTLLEKDMGPVHVVAHKETTWEETQDEKALEKELQRLSEENGKDVSMHWVWGNTLHHVEDLPFNAGGPGLPETFTAYRKQIEAQGGPDVRPEIAIPDEYPEYPLELRLESDPWPSLREDLKVEGLCDPHEYAFPHPNGVMDFRGGHLQGEGRMDEYIWDSQSLDIYKETRNDSGKRNCSSKFSPWLSLGCISPRTIYWQCKEFEEKIVANESTYWMVFELMTRDYFRWISASVGSKLFALNGFTGRHPDDKSIWSIPHYKVTKKHRELLQKWMDGQTGVPYVDSSMRELAATGFMSNRGRQNVASFLIHDIGFPDWRAGAEYFESLLIDHDVAANWGNWAYLAGVGSDPRGGRKFNLIKQSMQYDPEGWFITRWCPELVEIPAPAIHQPHVLSKYELEDFNLKEGDYPKPIVHMPEFVPGSGTRR